MKTKKMRIFSKLFAALVVLTLISCCFMGTTFARYVTTGTNVATVSVANWNVTITPSVTSAETSNELWLGNLSPDKDGFYNEENPSNATHSTGRIKIAEINIYNEVDAQVYVDLGEISYDLADSVTFSASGAPAKSEVDNVFQIKLYDAATGGNELSLNKDNIWQTTVNAYTAVTYKIYAEVTWITWYAPTTEMNQSVNGKWIGENADAMDTWLGENLEGISWNIEYRAVQASEVPKA